MKVIAFSLWGDKPIYNAGAIANAKLALSLFPDWVCRFYVGKNTDPFVIDELRRFNNVEVVDTGIHGTMKSMVWRFTACSDSNVSIVLSRDTDSRLSVREVEAVDMWLKSEKDFHIIRDHPHHGAPILGGLWGARGGLLKDINALLTEFESFGVEDAVQYDQTFLKKMVFDRVRHNSFVNDEFFDKVNPLTSDRDVNGVFFLGEIFNADGSFHSQHHRDLLIDYYASNR